MPRAPLLLASFGLALNVMLWCVPGMVAASALPHAFVPDSMPTLAAALARAERDTGDTPSVPDALLRLIGAESEALQVAGLGLQQPAPADLAARANHAGQGVLAAVNTYVAASRAALHAPGN
jgi:hypothetical protein